MSVDRFLGLTLQESFEPRTEAEKAWRREVAAGAAALDRGEIETTPWDELRDATRARLRGHLAMESLRARPYR